MKTLRRFLLSLVVVLFSYSTVSAYTPPPATNLFALLQPKFTISLPPLNLIKPDRFRFDNKEYSFDDNGAISPVNEGVSVQRISVNGTQLNDYDDYYVIKIHGLVKEPSQSLKNLRLTFKKPASNLAIDNQETYLKTRPLSNAFLSKGDCQLGAQSHICLVTKITLRTLDGRLSPIILNQTLPLKGIIVEGNVAGERLEGFTIDGSAIAVGDTVNVTGGTSVGNYFSSSKLKWEDIDADMTAIYDKRARGSKVIDTALGKTDNDGAFPGTSAGFGSCQGQPTWNLNSNISNNPCGGESDSFTSPPEGKLWNIEKSDVQGISGTFQLGVSGNFLTFSGSGTLVFGGDVIINSPIRCAKGTRLGIMTRGNIIINTSEIECGTFVTLGGSTYYGNRNPRLGDITIGNAPKGNLKVILVAKNNITLPSVANLTGPFIIKYDSLFANNPTILFREILSLVQENLS